VGGWGNICQLLEVHYHIVNLLKANRNGLKATKLFWSDGFIILAHYWFVRNIFWKVLENTYNLTVAQLEAVYTVPNGASVYSGILLQHHWLK